MNKVITYIAIVLVGLPSGAFAGSIAGSLIEGRTPEQAVTLLAEQVDTLLGRVDVLESTVVEQKAVIEEQRAFIENVASTTAAAAPAIDENAEECAQLDEDYGQLTDAMDEVNDDWADAFAALRAQSDTLTKEEVAVRIQALADERDTELKRLKEHADPLREALEERCAD